VKKNEISWMKEDKMIFKTTKLSCCDRFYCLAWLVESDGWENLVGCVD
jgi:hypothetical protein